MSDENFDVGYVAKLAHIELTNAEAEAFGRQLGDVLAYMEQLEKVDVSDIKPTMHGHGRVNAFREDDVTESLPREAVLANAPKKSVDEFVLPKIVEDAES